MSIDAFWAHIIITFSTAVVFLVFLCAMMMYRSRWRHRRLTTLQKRVRLSLKQEGHRAAIIQQSMDMVKYRMEPPVTTREVPCFVLGVCHDVRLEAKNVHEKLMGVVQKIPELSSRASSMTFREIVQYLQARMSKSNGQDHHVWQNTIAFHEEVRFSHHRMVSKDEWESYIRGVETIIERTKALLVM